MAEAEILHGGQWEPRRFQAEGAVHVEIMGQSGTQIRLDEEGLQAQLRRQSDTGGAFALQGAREGATLFATAQGGGAFPGGAVVDLSLSFPSARRDYLIERIDISGHLRAPLARISADGDHWVLSPAEAPAIPAPARSGALDTPDRESPSGPRATASEDGTIPQLLGAWIGRRRGDRGAAVLPEVLEVRIDRSTSMAPLAERAEILRDLVLALASAGGGPLPDVGKSSVGGTVRNGVGSAALDPLKERDRTGRTLLITDIPVHRDGVASLVIGDPKILEVLRVEDAYVVPSEAWRELEREDARFDDATLRRLEPLTDWLTGETRLKGPHR